ncbi:MAG: Ig-like domain-containing protein [Deltaproteobacteria bacterium]|nr:Ig-like domain-containing protein [Deltaproteobacteria bacterium]
MYALLIPLLIGCGPTPSSIDIQAEPVVKVHSLEQVAIPPVKVLAADKTVIEPPPQIKWEVLPPEVAKLNADGKSIAIVGEGKATVKATVGAISNKYELVVALPDEIALTGLEAGQILAVGQAVDTVAEVKADGEVVPEQAITWTSSNPEVLTVVDGKVTGVQAGKATVTATSGAQTKSVDVEVSATAAVPPPAPATGVDVELQMKTGSKEGPKIEMKVGTKPAKI